MNENIIDRPIREASQAHVALALVLDISGSMQGKSIRSLNDAVNGMIEQMKFDERLRNIVDLSIFLFGDPKIQNIYQGFRAIADCEKVNISANGGSTYVVDALEMALEITRNRCVAYDKAGGSYKPWVILITDGEFFDEESALLALGSKVREREAQGKLNFFGLGVKGYDRKQLEHFTSNPGRIIDVSAANFGEFLSWVGRSLKAVSTKEVGATVTLEPLVFTI
jgi:uncharacterized protein YegL